MYFIIAMSGCTDYSIFSVSGCTDYFIFSVSRYVGYFIFSVSGCTDYFAGTEEEAFATCRASVSAFNIAPVYNDRVFSEPDYDSAELLGIIPANGDEPMDMYKASGSLSLHSFVLILILNSYCLDGQVLSIIFY